MRDGRQGYSSIEEQMASIEERYRRNRQKEDAKPKRPAPPVPEAFLIKAREARINARKRAARRRRAEKEEKRILEERKELAKTNGKYGEYRILVMRNCVREKTLGKYEWLLEAKKAFSEFVALNKSDEQAMFPLGMSCDEDAPDYEILLVEIESDEVINGGLAVRDETTNIVEQYKVEGAKRARILRKASWLVPTMFSVSGYTWNQKKNARHVYDTLIAPYGKSDMDILTVGTMGNILYIRRDGAVDFVKSRQRMTCLALYAFFRSYCRKNKNILFIGECPESVADDLKKAEKRTRRKNGREDE